jgi:hypothetical protein
MTTVLTLVFLIALEYLVIKTAYKYDLPSIYDKFIYFTHQDSLLRKILPPQFCLQCFLVQSSLIICSIIVLLQQIPLYNIIIYGVIVASTVLWVELNEQ